MHFGSRGPSKGFERSSRIRHWNALTEKAWEDALQGQDKCSPSMTLISFFFRWIRHIFSAQKPLSLSCLIQLVWKKNYYRKRTSSWISRKIWNWRYYGLRGKNNQNLFDLGNFFCDTLIKMRQMWVFPIHRTESDWYNLYKRLFFLPYIFSSILWSMDTDPAWNELFCFHFLVSFLC